MSAPLDTLTLAEPADGQLGYGARIVDETLYNLSADDSGETVPNPIDAVDYENLRPVYESLTGWSESTVGLKSLDALPITARAYISRLEELVGAPIDIISTGPDREETILLRHPFGG